MTAETPGPTYRVRQTDCRTGWQVVDPAGRPVETYRRYEAASDAAEILNYTWGTLPQETFDSQLDYPERHTDRNVI